MSILEKGLIKTIGFVEEMLDSPSNQVRGEIHERNLRLAKDIRNYIKAGCLGLDIGTGDGIFSRACTDNGLKTVGIEPHMKIEKDLCELGVNGTGELLPFDDDSFDFVTILFVLHHCPDPIKVLEEAVRVTKRGGYIFIKDETLRNKLMYPLARANEVVANNRATPNREKHVESFVGKLHYLSISKFKEIFHKLNIELVEHKELPIRKKVDYFYKTIKHFFVLRKR